MVAIRSFGALGMLTVVVCHRIREDAGGEMAEETFDLSAEVYPHNRHNQGCHLIHSEYECTSSVDGRSGTQFGGQNCAWCCGDACVSSEAARCQPEGWLNVQANRVGHYKTGAGVNQCNGRSPTPSPSHNSYNQGCHLIHSESECVSSTDGRYGSQFGGQACAWCCGDACVSSEPARCQPEDWLNVQGNRVGHYKTGTRNSCYRYSLAETSDESAEVKSAEVYPHDSNNQGCHTLNSESQCLSSLDGRSGSEWGGQYCAWCCGAACLHTEPAKCQPADWLAAHHANSRRAGYSVPGYKLMWDLGHNECE